VLDSAGILHSGSGSNDYFALRPTFFTHEGTRIAFLSMCNRTGREYNFQPFLDAGASKPGFGYLLPHTLERWVPYCADRADLVVVQLHSGEEYETAPDSGFGFAYLDEGNPVPSRPSRYERELRRYAIDLGADIVVNHHPHVLQGFEMHGGKLIAHSMGNFIFDMDRIECNPTCILYTRGNRNGLRDHYVKPAYVDDWVPSMATGQLGESILDRLADYSRELNTVLIPNYEENTGRIVVDPLALTHHVIRETVVVPVQADGPLYISAPFRMDGPGFASAVLSVESEIVLQDPEVSIGREILWFGSFEDEGHTMWYLNTDDEWLDSTVAHSGQRSLALRRSDLAGVNIVANLESKVPLDSEHRYSMMGWIRTENAGETTFEARYHRYRYFSSPVGTDTLNVPLTGDHDFGFHWANMVLPEDANFLDPTASLHPPDSGMGFAWFDEIKVLEWEEWESASDAIPIAYPGTLRYAQARSRTQVESIAVVYELTRLDGGYGVPPRNASTAESPGADLHFSLGANRPNPFRSLTRISYAIPAACHVKLDVFNVSGRRVATLLDERREPGVWTTTWDGGASPSGLYFYRLMAGELTATRKMLLLR
jgi:hypothetical protein